MAITFNSSTPAAPAGGVNGTWQKDGSGNVSIYFPGGGSAGEAIKTANYSAVAGDAGKLIQFNAASAVTYTLLATPASALWSVVVYNRNIGPVAIARNGTTIDGKSANLTLLQGDAVVLYTDGTNYFTASPRPQTVGIFAGGVGSNAQVLLYLKLDRPCIFPASAPNSFAEASIAATGSTTFTFKKNGASFATVVFSGAGTTGAFTQASDATFVAGDIIELDGPGTADATLANIGFTLQGYRF